ncbi:MAG: carbon-nitrogen hydrolase family protein, partial [Bacteroidia bacterium]|nr:carbon-nitrogen hydrolase family protein [Bacteroidia bacterium]MDW8235614.1 carbon-nitrogen hydrolase family protein [Bacteroidia bacterium]
PLLLLLSLLLLQCHPAPCTPAPPPTPSLQTWQLSTPLPLLGIQPTLSTQDYACRERLYQVLNFYLKTARQRGCLAESSIVVFPEYIGSWLVLEGLPAWVLRASTLREAMIRLAMSSPLAFLRAWWHAYQTQTSDPSTAAVFHLRAISVARSYHSLFSQLARHYKVYIVAGSVVLPGPFIEKDSLYITPKAPLYNLCVVYQPDGRPFPHFVQKVFLTQEEQAFTQAGNSQALPTFSLPQGKLGVLICADSWYPESYEALGKVDWLVVPSYLMGDSAWCKPWKGYSGHTAPADVVEKNNLTEGQAWLQYALAGRLPKQSNRAVGLNVFLWAKIFEVGADGWGTVVSAERYDTTKANILCLMPEKGK